MRVVAGELRGRRLVSPPKGADVRPTADRVREALFSILGDVSGDRVLDLYCGTGALAIEALSRGATEATLVDLDVALAARNRDALGLGDRCRPVRSDVLRFLCRDRGSYGLIFCDPPYRLADRLEGKLDSLAAPRLAEGGRLIIESAARRPLRTALPVLAERTYGETLIRVHAGPVRGDG
ncbi:MAG: RsmD family RNA methyltransferase [bacterium]